jgi:hypothetical protein
VAATLKHGKGRLLRWGKSYLLARRHVFDIVLASGKGKRLHPLTVDRAKHAIRFAGHYRVIDLALVLVADQSLGPRTGRSHSLFGGRAISDFSGSLSLDSVGQRAERARIYRRWDLIDRSWPLN